MNQSIVNKNAFWNKDLAPTGVSQRTFRWFDFAALWVGMVVCIPPYTLAGSLIKVGLSAPQAILTVFLGNAIAARHGERSEGA